MPSDDGLIINARIEQVPLVQNDRCLVHFDIDPSNSENPFRAEVIVYRVKAENLGVVLVGKFGREGSEHQMVPVHKVST